MNLQALMKQAQSMQKNLTDAKKKVESMIFTGSSELVDVEMNGKREMISTKIKTDGPLDKEDIEILQDMLVIAVNDATKKIDRELKEKLGSSAGALDGLF